MVVAQPDLNATIETIGYRRTRSQGHQRIHIRMALDQMLEAIQEEGPSQPENRQGQGQLQTNKELATPAMAEPSW